MRGRAAIARCSARLSFDMYPPPHMYPPPLQELGRCGGVPPLLGVLRNDSSQPILREYAVLTKLKLSTTH